MCLSWGTMVHLLRVVISYIICSFNENIGRFCIQILCSLSFFYFTAFSNSHVTLHAHTHICRSTSTPNLIENDSSIAKCCTPKFSLPYFSKQCKKDPQVTQSSPRVWPDKLSPKAVYPKLGFHVASRYLSPSYPKFSPMS